MSKRKFFQYLRLVAPNFKWSINHTLIRGKKGEHNFCPITAVYNHLYNGAYTGLSGAFSAGRIMGMTDKDITDIMKGADYTESFMAGTSRRTLRRILFNENHERSPEQRGE